jgi:hypothetical protein
MDSPKLETVFGPEIGFWSWQAVIGSAVFAWISALGE